MPPLLSAHPRARAALSAAVPAGTPSAPATTQSVARQLWQGPFWREQWTCAGRRQVACCSPAVYAAAHLALIALGSYGSAPGQLQGFGQLQELQSAAPTIPLIPGILCVGLGAGLGSLLWLLYG